MRPRGPMCAPEHHDHDQDAHNAPRVARNTLGSPPGANIRNEKVRDSSLLSSTIVMSEDITEGLNLYCGYSGALDVSGLLTDSLPGGGVDDAAVEAVKRCG
jgi:hypothetical protein